MKQLILWSALVVLIAPDLRAEDAVAAEAKPAEEATGVPVVPAEDSAALVAKVGTEVIVEGTVRNVGRGQNDGITFLNFGDRRAGFVAVVFAAAYSNFPDGFDGYAQQKVRVRGQLEKYRDQQLQIKITTADQLEIVSGESAD
ncbi:MAG: OB-fold nucleic acid binding domain-containing protein [Chthoniobacterales bacterium]